MDMRIILAFTLFALVLAGCTGNGGTNPVIPPANNSGTGSGVSGNLSIERLNSTNLAQGDAFIRVQNPKTVVLTANIYTGYPCVGTKAYWTASNGEIDVYFTHELPKGMACATVLEARTYATTLDLSAAASDGPITSIKLFSDGKLLKNFEFNGMFCGGIAAFQCPDRYDCVLDGDYPDAGGHCANLGTGGTPEPGQPGTPVKPVDFCMTSADCVVGGCSGQLCLSNEQAKGGGITTCEWKEEYACYTADGCGCVANRCQWSDAVLSCVETKRLGGNSADLSGPLNVRTGSHFSVKLYSNPTTGYDWSIDVSNTSVVEYLGYDADNCAGTTPGIVGAGCDMNYKFVAKELGSAKITMRYARSWETGIAPANLTVLDVNVVGST